MSLSVIILGGGGHAKVLIEALRASGSTILGVVDPDPAKRNTSVLGVAVLGDDSAVFQHRPGSILLANGVGSVHLPRTRIAIFEEFRKEGYAFVKVVHPTAVIATDVILDEGAQVMAGAVIQPGGRIGANAIVNTNTTVDHDCTVGDHVHVSPGATLCGGVSIGSGSHVGAGATVIQGITIGRNCLIGAGAVVIFDVPDSKTVVGVPAKEARS